LNVLGISNLSKPVQQKEQKEINYYASKRDQVKTIKPKLRMCNNQNYCKTDQLLCTAISSFIQTINDTSIFHHFHANKMKNINKINRSETCIAKSIKKIHR
jgi:hypothetical protein